MTVISRISDLFGIGSKFGSLETGSFLSFSLAPRKILTRAFPIPQCPSKMGRRIMTFAITSEMKKT